MNRCNQSYTPQNPTTHLNVGLDSVLLVCITPIDLGQVGCVSNCRCLRHNCTSVSALFCTSDESLRDWCCRKLAAVLRVAIAEGKLVSPSHNQVYVVCCVLLNKRDLFPIKSQDVSACCVQAQIASEQERLANTRVQPDCALSLQANKISQQRMSTASSLADILRRPHVHYR